MMTSGLDTSSPLSIDDDDPVIWTDPAGVDVDGVDAAADDGVPVGFDSPVKPVNE